jgi:hypothetical protein
MIARAESTKKPCRRCIKLHGVAVAQFLFLGMVASLIWCRAVWCQEETVVVSIEFSEREGMPFVRKATVFGLPEPDASLAMLADANVQKELELDEGQIQLLDRARSDLKVATSQFWTSHRKLSALSPRKAELDHLRDVFRMACERARSNYEDVLLPHQKKRLKEVFVRVRVAQIGLYSFLFEDDYLNVDKPEADKLAAIKELMRTEEKSFLVQIKQEYGELIGLAKERYPEVSEYLTAIIDEAPIVSVDVLLADLNSPLDFSAIREVGNLKTCLSNVRFLELNAANNWQAKVQADSPFIGLVKLVAGLESEYEGLFSDEQAKAILDLNSEYRTRRRAFRIENQRETDDLYRAGDSEMAREEAKQRRDEAREKYNKKLAELDDEFFARVCDEVLTPAQQEWLLEHYRQRKANSYGLFGIVLVATEMSEKGRKEMEELLVDKVKTFEQSVIKQYRDALERQIEALPVEIREKLSEAMGDAPEYLRPNLSVLEGCESVEGGR